MTVNYVTQEQIHINVPEANEHVLTGVVYKMSTLVVNSLDNTKGVRDKRECLNLASFYIDIVHKLSSLAESNVPLTEEMIRTYVSIYAEKGMADKVLSALYPPDSVESQTPVQARVLDNGLSKVVLKAKSLIIGMPFSQDSDIKKQKYIGLTDYVYEFVHEAKTVIASGEDIDLTKIFVGGYFGAKPPALSVFLEGVLGKFKPVRIVDGDKVMLVSHTIFPELCLVHTLQTTAVATEQNHSFYLVGINKLPKGYDYQPEMGGLHN